MLSKQVKQRIARNKLRRLRRRDFLGDMLNDLASCECGVTLGEHNLGVVCRECHTEVRNPTLRPPTLERKHILTNAPAFSFRDSRYIYGAPDGYKKIPDVTRVSEDKLLIVRPASGFEQSQMEIIRHALDNPSIKWESAFKKQGE